MWELSVQQMLHLPTVVESQLHTISFQNVKTLFNEIYHKKYMSEGSSSFKLTGSVTPMIESVFIYIYQRVVLAK